ncbi:hypothetical protein FKP32DRAFT_1681289 [Trametes sanguinea]|nr:hypothetical protein FKP32DRAFT_1681289 [Trametes sanguinea]
MHFTTTIAIDSPTRLTSSMSSAPSLSSSGPYYVLLGGENFGIHEGARPPNTALGNFRSLLPVVVCCALLRDAEAINRLNADLFVRVAPNDVFTLLRYIQWDEGPVSKVQLITPGPYYAIRTAKAGKETGVWIGYPWGPLAQNVSKESVWHKYDTIQECLAFMVEKYDYNLPLLPQGKKLPPPTEPLTYARPSSHVQAGDESASTSPSTSRPRAAPMVKREPSQQAARPEHGQSPDKPGRSASPTKSSRKRVAVVVQVSAASPLPTGSLARSATPSDAVRRVPRVQEVPDSPSDDSHSDDGGFDTVDNDAASVQARDEAFSTQAWLSALQRLIRVPAAMSSGEDNGFPVNFGPVAESIMLAAGATADDVWTVLQIRVHARSPEAFTHYVGLQLGWLTRRSLALWHAMEFPRV